MLKQLMMGVANVVHDAPWRFVAACVAFQRAQNEDVVEWLLVHEPRATTAPIQQAGGWPCTAGGVPHSVRLDPRTSDTSALFICKIVKGSSSIAIGREGGRGLMAESDE